LKKIIIKIKNNVWEYYSNPQCFKEKNYIVKFSTSSIFKKISKDNFEKKIKKKKKKKKKKSILGKKKREKKHVKKKKKKQKPKKKTNCYSENPTCFRVFVNFCLLTSI